MKQYTSLKTGIFLSLMLMCLSACARLPTAPVGERPVVQSAQDLLKELETRANAIQSLRAKGQVAVVSPQKNYSGNALLTESKPSHLRVDVLNFWGQPVVAFVTTGQQIKFMVYPESKLYRGPATATNLGRFIPLPVSLQDFMAILTGRIAFDQYDKPVLLESRDSNVYLLELSSRGSSDRVMLTLEAQSLNIISAQWLNPQGQELMQAEFSEFTTQGQVTGPREIKMASGDRNNQVRVRYRDLTYNVPPAPEAFELPVSGAVQELSFPQ